MLRVTTHLMVEMLRLSYLHSHRGQNSFAFNCTSVGIFGNTTHSQLQFCGFVLSIYTDLCGLSEMVDLVVWTSMDLSVDAGMGPTVGTVVLGDTTRGEGQIHLQRTSSYCATDEWTHVRRVKIASLNSMARPTKENAQTGYGGGLVRTDERSPDCSWWQQNRCQCLTGSEVHQPSRCPSTVCPWTIAF